MDKTKYITIVVLLSAFYVMWLAIPIIWYPRLDEGLQEVLIFSGYGSPLSENTLLLVSYTVILFVSRLSLITFNIWARRIFSGVLILGLTLLPFLGLGVSYSWDRLLAQLIAFGDGFLIAASYTSTVSNNYSSKG